MSPATNPIETLHSALAHAAYVAFSDYTYQDRNWAKHDAWRATLKREEYNIAVAPADCYYSVEKTRRHTAYDMTVSAMFVQTWSSTALGFGGNVNVGGALNAITSGYVTVIESQLTGEYAVYFYARLAYVIKHPNEKFWEDVHRHSMVDANKGKAAYERTNSTTC